MKKDKDVLVSSGSGEFEHPLAPHDRIAGCKTMPKWPFRAGTTRRLKGDDIFSLSRI
jgi:hypothetical protein